MLIGIVGDPHVSDKAPLTRKDDYRQAILDKLEFCIDESNKRKYSALIIPGDLFHKKIPSHNSHALVSSLITMFQKSYCPILVVAGNHDISGNMTNFYQQPLYVLERAKVLRVFDNSKPEILMEGDFSVSINGAPYSMSRDQKDASILYDLNHAEADLRIGVFHQMLLPTGQTFFSDFINFEDLLDVNSDVIIDGHYHVGFDPVVQEVGSKYFVNGGSISRGSSDNFNLEKVPKMVELFLSKDEDGVKVLYDTIDIPCEDSSKIFDKAAIKKRKETQEMRDFINNLSEFEAESLSTQNPDGILRMLESMGMDRSLRETADKYLTNAYEKLGK